MERFVRGDIVVLSYPTFSGTETKKRPALIIATTPMGAILCPITSKKQEGFYPILIKDSDILSGKLKQESFVLCSWLSSFQFQSILYKIGSLKQDKFLEILNIILQVIKG